MLTTSIAAGAAATLTIGGYAITDSGSSSSANAATNVHIIGVNRPHHVFVSKSFKVVGAE